MKTLIAPRALKGMDQAAMADQSARYSRPVDGYQSSWTGLGIQPAMAMNVMTVYQCVTKLADAFAELPLILYRRNGRSRDRATEHPLYRTFHDAPNPAMSSFTWRRLVMGHLATWGNAYNEIVTNGLGEVELWPFRPDRIEVEWADGGNSRTYYYVSPGGERKKLDTARMFHLQGFSSDGLVGLAPITQMRRAIGLYRKAEQYGESVFDNGARPATVLKHPKTLSDPAVNRLAAQMDALRGSGNAGKTVVLEEGLDINEIGFPPEDAQFMETRLFQKRELFTGFNLPLSLSGDADFADVSVEDKLRELFQISMPAHFKSFQQEAQIQVIKDPDLYVEFLTDALMWADPKARADALAVDWEHGVINADGWLETTNRPPLPDGLGQTYFRPANWVPVDDEDSAVGGDASTSTQFGQDGPQPVPSDTPAALVDQVTRAKSSKPARLESKATLPPLASPLKQFDCPECGKLINRLAAAGTVGYCKSCRAERTFEGAAA